MKRKLLYTLMFSTVIVLTACGGGGGGGGGSPSYVQPSTNTAIQTVAKSYNPLSSPAGFIYSTVNMYNEDLTGSGSQNVIVAGSSVTNTSSVMKVYGWSGTTLVDQTSQWFDAGENVINPGASKLSFGNFNGTGQKSMYVNPGTDNHSSTNSVSIFVNNGSKFTKYNVALTQPLDSMDSTTFTYGGVDNIIALGYPYSQAIMGSTTNNFKAYAVSNVSGSAIASGNFLGNGSPSFVVGQYGSSTTLGATPDALVGFSQDAGTGAVTMPFIRNLPVPLFNTSPYFALTGGSNTIRVVKFDFDGSGNDSLFITAMPNNWQISPYQSSIQFLKNNGAGVFTDVTSTTVTGYDMTKAASTNPIIVDIYNTGLPSIVLPALNGTQVLTQVSKGQFVASMANTITTFQNNVNSLVGSTLDTQGGTTTFVKGPNNTLYLLDMVPLNMPDGTSQKGIYLTPLSGTSAAVSAQTAITLARTAWPWITDAQLNTMLKATGSTFAGATVINAEALLTPDGPLMLFNKNISGYVAGLQMGPADTTVATTDRLGRTFMASMTPTQVRGWNNAFSMDSEHIDQHELTGHTEYLIAGAVNNVGPFRMGNELQASQQFGALPGKFNNYTFGIPRLWEKGNWSAGAQYTTLNYNPWVAFGGSWGQVTQTGNLDHTIRYIKDGFSAVVGGTYTTTNITPGLITKVNDIYGVWGETGYKWASNLGIYAGVKPIAVKGNVESRLPTSVDTSGNLVYTGKTLALQNQTTGYIRALWTTNIDKKTMYRVSGTVMSNGQSRIMNELRYSFD